MHFDEIRRMYLRGESVEHLVDYFSSSRDYIQLVLLGHIGKRGDPRLCVDAQLLYFTRSHVTIGAAVLRFDQLKEPHRSEIQWMAEQLVAEIKYLSYPRALQAIYEISQVML